jgi:hypothetical protein
MGSADQKMRGQRRVPASRAAGDGLRGRQLRTWPHADAGHLPVRRKKPPGGFPPLGEQGRGKSAHAVFSTASPPSQRRRLFVRNYRVRENPAPATGAFFEAAVIKFRILSLKSANPPSRFQAGSELPGSIFPGIHHRTNSGSISGKEVFQDYSCLILFPIISAGPPIPNQ